MLKGTALRRMVMSLLETGWHPMTVLTVSLWTRNPRPCSCLSSFPLNLVSFLCCCFAKMPLQHTTHLIQRPCYQRGSPCQDPAGKLTTRRPPDDRKETQTAVVWSCFSFIRFGQNHLARHSERGKKTRHTEEDLGRQHQGTDRPGVRQVPEGSGEQGKMGGNGCEIICDAPTTLAVKG